MQQIRTLKSARTKLFLMMYRYRTVTMHDPMRKYESSKTSHSAIECLGYGQDSMGFEQGGKIHLLSTHCSLEKNFQTVYNFSRLLPDLKNCFANFKTFSRFQ